MPRKKPLAHGGARKGAGRPPSTEPLDARVMVRLSARELDVITARARDAQMRVSAWIRKLATE